MATRTIYICDHCGREFDQQAEDLGIKVGNYTVVYELLEVGRYEHGEKETVYDDRYHICWPCITDALRKFIEKENA